MWDPFLRKNTGNLTLDGFSVEFESEDLIGEHDVLCWSERSLRTIFKNGILEAYRYICV